MATLIAVSSHILDVNEFYGRQLKKKIKIDFFILQTARVIMHYKPCAKHFNAINVTEDNIEQKCVS